MISQNRPRALDLSLVAFALGAGVILPSNLHGEAGSVSAKLVSPTEVESPAGLGMFEKLHYVVFEPDLPKEPTNLWWVSGVFTLYEAVPGEEEDDEDTYVVHYFANYRSINTGSRRENETGLLGWVLDTEEEPAALNTSNAVGFIRADRRPSQFGGNPPENLFNGASGALSWTHKSNASRSTSLTLTGAAYAPEAVLTDNYVTLTLQSTTSLTLSAFDFPVPGTTPAVYWSFGSPTLRQVADGKYAGLIERTDRIGRELSDGELSVPEFAIKDNVDADSFWARYYILELTDSQDSDRDGIPDFADLSRTLVAFPWYADYSAGNDWYYSVWMNAWVRSDIFSDWDYHYKLGWIYVPYSSDQYNFWMWVNAPSPGASRGWMYTNIGIYPWFYQFATGEWLYYWVDGNGQAAFYKL